MGEYQSNEEVRTKIDKLLMKIASAEANLGKDSNKREFTTCKAKQAKYLEEIKTLDFEFYNVIVVESDKK